MDFVLDQDDVIKLLLALLIGGLIGAEREYRDKAAGFRTIIFICVGSALFTMFSIKMANNSDPARIAAQIVSGVGFLGGGAILRDRERVMGLTTAATIWLTAALGMGVGSGNYELAGVATAVILVVLWLFPYIEHLIDRTRHSESYEIVTPIGEQHYADLRNLFSACGLHILMSKRRKIGDTMHSVWLVHGSLEGHAQLTERLFAREDVLEFHE